jgi:hypothetical protein
MATKIKTSKTPRAKRNYYDPWLDGDADPASELLWQRHYRRAAPGESGCAECEWHNSGAPGLSLGGVLCCITNSNYVTAGHVCDAFQPKEK